MGKFLVKIAKRTCDSVFCFLALSDVSPGQQDLILMQDFLQKKKNSRYILNTSGIITDI